MLLISTLALHAQDFTNLQSKSKIVFLSIAKKIIVYRNMKTKKEIVNNWLPRYTGEKLENFGEYILLTNFSNYVKMFAEMHNVKIVGLEKAMECATADNITIINFGMGSPGAATIMDLLSAIEPKAVLFLRKMWRIKKKK